LAGIIRHNLAPSMCSQAWVGILVTLEGIIVDWVCILEHEQAPGWDKQAYIIHGMHFPTKGVHLGGGIGSWRA